MRLLITAILIVLFLSSNLFALSDTKTKRFAKDAADKGWNYLDRGDLKTAFNRFRQATIIDPDFAPGYFGMAYVYSVQNDFEKAVEYYKKSIEKDAAFPHSHSNLGLAYVSMGKLKEAKESLDKALKLAPNESDVHVNLAEYYMAAKDYKKAWEHTHTAKKLGGDVKQKLIDDLSKKMPDPGRN